MLGEAERGRFAATTCRSLLTHGVETHPCHTESIAYILKVNQNYIRHKTTQYLQLIFIHGFRTWDCANISLSPRYLSHPGLDLHRIVGDLSCPMHISPAELKWSGSYFLFQLSFCKQVLLLLFWVWSIECHAFYIFLLVILLLKTAPTISDEMLASIPKHKKAVIPLRGKYVVR